MNDNLVYIPTQDEKVDMIDAMKRYGGGFVVALAECFTHADSRNYIKLCNAFPEYVKSYLDLAKGNAQKVAPGTEL